MPLPLKGLHHIARTTSNAEAAIAFYCEVLGFRELPRPPFSFRGAWLYNYGFQIHLIENENAVPGASETIDTRKNHLAFSTDNIQTIIDELTKHGIPFRENHNAGGSHQVFFQDPDGHHIEIAVYGDPAQGYSPPQ